MKSSSRHWIPALLLIAVTSCASDPAKTRPSDSVGPARPRLQVPQAIVTPRVDADPDDPAWHHAVTIPSLGLSILPPDEKAARSGRVAPPTEVKLLWDAKWLYVRFLCDDWDIYAPVVGRDAPIYKADVVEVFLDPVGDARQWFELEANTNNDVLDATTVLSAEPKSRPDGRLTADIIDHQSWFCLDYTIRGLRTAATVRRSDRADRGWIVDLAIPAGAALRRLDRQQFTAMTLRANFLRYDYIPDPSDPSKPRALIALNWSPVLDGQPHTSPQAMGFIELVEPLRRASAAGN